MTENLEMTDSGNGICTGDNNEARYAAISILSTVCILTVFGNTMVLLAFIRNRGLRSSGNYFLISLAISDLIMGLWTFPNTISNLVICKTWMSAILCQISGYIDNVIVTNSLMTLAACSYDRYLIITKPLFYKSSMTGRKIILILCATWIFSMVLSVPPFFGIGQFSFSDYSKTCALNAGNISNNGTGVDLKSFEIYFSCYIVLSFIPPLSIMVVCYTRIFQTAKMVSDNNPALQKQGGAWRGIKNFKAGLMIAVIIGVFLVFVLPVSVMALIQIIFKVKSIPKEAALVVTYLLLCNSFCNPIIYGIMNKEFRQEFKNIVRCTSDRSYRQQNMRRESLAFSSSYNGSVLVKKPLSTSANSALNSLGSTICTTTSLSRTTLARSNSELKRYITGKRNNSVTRRDQQAQDPLFLTDRAGTIMELSEHSTCSAHKTDNHTFRPGTTLNSMNPFKYIWNLKSASYECICERQKNLNKTYSF